MSQMTSIPGLEGELRKLLEDIFSHNPAKTCPKVGLPGGLIGGDITGLTRSTFFIRVPPNVNFDFILKNYDVIMAWKRLQPRKAFQALTIMPKDLARAIFYWNISPIHSFSLYNKNTRMVFYLILLKIGWEHHCDVDADIHPTHIAFLEACREHSQIFQWDAQEGFINRWLVKQFGDFQDIPLIRQGDAKIYNIHIKNVRTHVADAKLANRPLTNWEKSAEQALSELASFYHEPVATIEDHRLLPDFQRKMAEAMWKEQYEHETDDFLVNCVLDRSKFTDTEDMPPENYEEVLKERTDETNAFFTAEEARALMRKPDDEAFDLLALGFKALELRKAKVERDDEMEIDQ